MRTRSINTECRVMRAISSHRDHRGSKMRFLIVSAFLACATAAPSVLAPIAVGLPAVPVAYPAALPTISSGDIQAAEIDARVKAQDMAIAAADKAREQAEQASEDMKEKAVVETDVVKENNEEAFWSTQEKQWQVIDALKTAQAQLDGAIANNAPLLAKNIIGGPYVTAVGPIAPIPPIVYTPSIIAPAVKTMAEPAKVEEAKPKKMDEALTKSTEEVKEEKDSVAIEASKENMEAKPQLAPLLTRLAIQPYGYPIVAPVALTPALNYGVYPQIGLTPTIVKTGW